MIADIGMYGVGIVYRCCATRQGDNLSLWREDIDGIGEKIDFDVL